MEELLAAGTLLLLLLLPPLPPPRRLAKPGPASAPRPPDIQGNTNWSPEILNRYSCMLYEQHVTQLTDPSESSWSDELHELVVAHVPQKVLQTALPWW